MSSAECHVDENHAISGMLGGSDCIATGGEGYSAAAKGGREFHRCNRCLAGTTLFNSPEVALANELSPEVELLSLDGVAFFEICNGRVVSWVSVERPDAEGSSCLISESADCDEVGGFLGVDAEVGKSSNRGNLVSSASISSKGSGG